MSHQLRSCGRSDVYDKATHDRLTKVSSRPAFFWSNRICEVCSVYRRQASTSVKRQLSRMEAFLSHPHLAAAHPLRPAAQTHLLKRLQLNS
jgi:hypothetical protein